MQHVLSRWLPGTQTWLTSRTSNDCHSPYGYINKCTRFVIIMLRRIDNNSSIGILKVTPIDALFMLYINYYMNLHPDINRTEDWIWWRELLCNLHLFSKILHIYYIQFHWQTKVQDNVVEYGLWIWNGGRLAHTSLGLFQSAIRVGKMSRRYYPHYWETLDGDSSGSNGVAQA